MKTVAIIIPVHNRIDVTQVGLEELYRALGVTDSCECRFRIVVVDDGSTDGTSEWISSQYPEVDVLTGDGNLWWSGSVNRGAEYSLETLNADFILLWNNDVVADDNYFDEICRITNVVGDHDICGSTVFCLNDKDRVWSSGGYFNRLWGLYWGMRQG